MFCPLTYHVRASWSLRVQRLSPRNHVIQHFSRGPNNEVTKADGLLCKNVPLRNWFRVITSAFVLRTDEVGRLRTFNLKSFFFLLPRLPNYTFGTSVRTSNFCRTQVTFPKNGAQFLQTLLLIDVILVEWRFTWRHASLADIVGNSSEISQDFHKPGSSVQTTAQQYKHHAAIREETPSVSYIWTHVKALSQAGQQRRMTPSANTCCICYIVRASFRSHS